MEENLQYHGKRSETIEVSVIGYCDEKSGWQFDASKCALYQNGKQVCGVSRTEKQADGAMLFIFDVPVQDLVPETALEARLTAVKEGEADATCATALNIHVFDFSITADDMDINTDTLSVDLQKGGDIFTKLFGSGKLNVNIGKNVAITAQTNGSEITLNFSAKASKKKESTYGSYQKGYEHVAGSRAHNKNTYFFTFDATVKDSDKVEHHLVYEDYDSKGNPKINTRDIALLQQYIVANAG